MLKKAHLQILTFGALSLILSACSNLEPGHSSHQILAKQKTSPQNNLDTTADGPVGEQATAPAESQPAQEAAPPQPQLPTYDPSRIAAAGQIKQYSGINIPGTDSNAFMRTKWVNGQVFMRLAILGSLPGVEQFVFGTKLFKVRFSDSTGAQVSEFQVRGEDVTRAPAKVNNGVPTYQFDSSADCTLEQYEQYVQWSLSWEFR